MPDAPATRTASLAALDAAYGRLHALVATIDEPHGAWNGAVGAWSVVNLLQHIDGWLQEMTGALQRLARGERPTPQGVDYANVNAWNARFVEARGEQSMAQALAAWEQRHAAFRAAAAAVPDDRWGEGKTVNRLVFGTAIEHYDHHRADLNAYLGGAHA